MEITRGILDVNKSKWKMSFTVNMMHILGMNTFDEPLLIEKIDMLLIIIIAIIIINKLQFRI